MTPGDLTRADAALAARGLAPSREKARAYWQKMTPENWESHT